MLRDRRSKICFLGGLLTGALIWALLAGLLSLQEADAQPSVAAQGEQYEVIPVQIGRTSSGLAVVNFSRKKLWVYELNRDGTARIRLLAARDFRYDELLPEYNSSDPTPNQVRDILEKLLEKEQSPGQ